MRKGDAQKGIWEVPEYHLELAAGTAMIPEREVIQTTRPFREEEVRRLAMHPDNLVMVRVRGESMYPTFYPGDEVLVDISAPVIVDDGIYAIRVDNTLKIKRLQHYPGGRIRLISDNPHYETYEINIEETVEDVAIIGRVVWGARRY